MIIDIVVIILSVLAIKSGWHKGAMAMLISLVFLIGAMLIATLIGTPVGKAFGIGASYLHPVLGFFIVFFIVMLIGSSLKKRIKLKQGMFATANNFLGAAFALARAVLVLGLLFGFFRMFGLPTAGVLGESKTYTRVMDVTSLFARQITPLVSTFKSSDVFEELEGIIDSPDTDSMLAVPPTQ